MGKILMFLTNFYQTVKIKPVKFFGIFQKWQVHSDTWVHGYPSKFIRQRFKFKHSVSVKIYPCQNFALFGIYECIHIRMNFNFTLACVCMGHSGDSRLSTQGGHYSKITFIVRPLHITLHFLNLYTLKIGLKLHVCVLKILGLAMPMYVYVNISSRFSTTYFSPGGAVVPP